MGASIRNWLRIESGNVILYELQLNTIFWFSERKKSLSRIVFHSLNSNSKLLLLI